jgi:hypothetical protein
MSSPRRKEQQVRTVKVEKEDMLERVRANRSTHRAVFEQALEGYRARMIAELERRIRDLKRGRRIDHYVGLPEPEDHTQDYDRVIAMAEMSVDAVVELEAGDFATFVLDQWQWKQSFTETTSHYVR